MNWSILTSHRFLVLAVAGLFIVGSYFHAFQAPERGVYDLASKALPSGTVSSAVVVVAVDNAAIKGIGSWPWPRDRIAATIDRLRRFGVRAIGVALPLSESQTPVALAVLVAEATKSGRKLSGTLKRWATQLDSDADLARAIARHGRVILSADIRGGEPILSAGGTVAVPEFTRLKAAKIHKPGFFSFLIVVFVYYNHQSWFLIHSLGRQFKFPHLVWHFLSRILFFGKRGV